MTRRAKQQEVQEPEELSESEEFISRDDLDIEVMSADDEPVVYIKISGFEEMEEASEYAEFLVETLPLLLFETTRFH